MCLAASLAARLVDADSARSVAPLREKDESAAQFSSGLADAPYPCPKKRWLQEDVDGCPPCTLRLFQPIEVWRGFARSVVCAPWAYSRKV
jgi:hypothetical protein